eukprot:Gb_19637 [translate_table: standard]
MNRGYGFLERRGEGITMIHKFFSERSRCRGGYSSRVWQRGRIGPWRGRGEPWQVDPDRGYGIEDAIMGGRDDRRCRVRLCWTGEEATTTQGRNVLTMGRRCGWRPGRRTMGYVGKGGGHNDEEGLIRDGKGTQKPQHRRPTI